MMGSCDNGKVSRTAACRSNKDKSACIRDKIGFGINQGGEGRCSGELRDRFRVKKMAARRE